MTCRLLSLSSEAMWPELLRLLENRDNPDQTVETDVRAMLDAVRKGGDSAVLEYVRRFDCPDMRPPLRVPAETTSAPSMKPKKIAHGSSPATTARSSARRSKLWTARAFMSPEGVAATRRSSRACS